MNIKQKEISDWILRQLNAEPALGNKSALTIIVLQVIAIGFSDYFTGIHLSLILFYFVPVTLAVVWLGWRAAAGVALGCALLRVVGDIAANESVDLPAWILWNGLSALFVFFILIWILESFVSLHRLLEKRIIERTAALVRAEEMRRQLEAELLEVGLRERNMIGHELHDEICQQLVGTALAAQVLFQRLTEKNNTLAADAEAIVRLLEEGADKTRQLAKGLLLSEIDPDALGEKLAEIADQASSMSIDSGIECQFRQVGETLVHDAGAAAHLFRIAHEALRNALKHASPRRVEISLVGSESVIELTVEDDGIGMDAAANLLIPPQQARLKSSGVGLRIMSNRAFLIGATLLIEPSISGGTKVICRLPRTLGHT